MIAILLLSFSFRNRVAKIAIFTEKATFFLKIYVYQPILRPEDRAATDAVHPPGAGTAGFDASDSARDTAFA